MTKPLVRRPTITGVTGDKIAQPENADELVSLSGG
jgi:hypothetical protein